MGANFSTKGEDKKQWITPLQSGAGYTTTLWNPKEIKRLVVSRQIAPLYPGTQEPDLSREDLEECPICFLYYTGGLNRVKCCKQSVCSECYLQVKKPNVTEVSTCPFCNKEGFDVIFRGPLTIQELEVRKEEERKVKELEEKMKEEERQRDMQRQQQREKEQREKREIELKENERREKEQREKELFKQQANTKEEENEELDEEMRLALQLSLQQPSVTPVPIEDEEEILNRAIALSLQDNN